MVKADTNTKALITHHLINENKWHLQHGKSKLNISVKNNTF
jgi:hypothetical protein